MRAPDNLLSPPVDNCDLCQRPLGQNFVNGLIRSGHFATMCLGCHRTEGIGLGPDRGHHYERQADGTWKKVA